MFRSWLLFIFVTGIVEVAGIRWTPFFLVWQHRKDHPPTRDWTKWYNEMVLGILTQTATPNMGIDTDHLATADESSYYMSEPTENPLMTTMDFTSQGFHYTTHEITEVEIGSEAVNSVHQNLMRKFYSIPRKITEGEMIANSDDIRKQLENLSVAVYTQLGIFVFTIILLSITVVLLLLYYRKMREIVDTLKNNITMQDLSNPERAGPVV